MAALSGLYFHVNGEAGVWVQFVGDTDPSKLGVTVNGVRMRFRRNQRPITIDTFGDCPVDVQQDPCDAFVTARLIWYNQTVLDRVRKMPGSPVTGSVEASLGEQSHAGLLLGQGYSAGAGAPNTYMNRLHIACPNLDEARPFNYPYNAYLFDQHEVERGTRASIWDLTWHCLPRTIGASTPANLGTSYGYVLFNHDATGIT